MNLKTSISPSPTIPTQRISALLLSRLKQKPLASAKKCPKQWNLVDKYNLGSSDKGRTIYHKTSYSTFRCVCKPWDSSITSPNFISTHLNNTNNDDDHAYLIQTCIHYNSSRIPKICKLLCCDHTFDWLFEYSVRSAFDLDTSQMVSSFNGLVCLVRYGNRSTTSDSKFLWNPSIRKFKRLPDPRLSQYFSRD